MIHPHRLERVLVYKEYAYTTISLCTAVLCDVSFALAGAPFFLTLLHVFCALPRALNPSLIVVALCGWIFDAHATSHFGVTSICAMMLMLLMHPIMIFIRKRPAFFWVWGSYIGFSTVYVFMTHSMTFGIAHAPQIFTLWGIRHYQGVWICVLAYPWVFYGLSRLYQRVFHG